MTRIVINKASQISKRLIEHFSFKRSFEIVTNFLRGKFLKFINNEVDISELINLISIILIKTSLKDTYYIRKKYA